MNEEQLKILVECEQRSKSNSKRIDELKASYDALNKLAVSVETMGVNIANMDKTIQKLDKKVEEQAAKPVKRWDNLIETVVKIVVGALLALVFTQIGLT